MNGRPVSCSLSPKGRGHAMDMLEPCWKNTKQEAQELRRGLEPHLSKVLPSLLFWQGTVPIYCPTKTKPSKQPVSARQMDTSPHSPPLCLLNLRHLSKQRDLIGCFAFLNPRSNRRFSSTPSYNYDPRTPHFPMFLRGIGIIRGGAQKGRFSYFEKYIFVTVPLAVAIARVLTLGSPHVR